MFMTKAQWIKEGKNPILRDAKIKLMVAKKDLADFIKEPTPILLYGETRAEAIQRIMEVFETAVSDATTSVLAAKK